MAKNPGKKFEEDFIKSIPDRCDVTRLKDAGGWSNATNMRFTSSNPCDFIIYSNRGIGGGHQYKLELKSLEGKSLPYGNIKGKKPATKKKPATSAKENSITFTETLMESLMKGVRAGFVVNFRDVNETFYVSAELVLEHLKNADRASIPIAWFKEYGILIKQTIVIKRYRYDLEWL
jgi:recombination protein U